MPRKKTKDLRRPVEPDRKYKSIMITKLINRLMQDGKKVVATGVVYDAIAFLADKTGEQPLAAFDKVIANIKPPVEVRSRRVGGATFQVPVEIRPERQDSLVLRWLVNISRDRKDKSMAQRLGKEMLDAFNNTGTCVKKRQDTIKMAEANKAFAHYKW